jgi:hypothetical protein
MVEKNNFEYLPPVVIRTTKKEKENSVERSTLGLDSFRVFGAISYDGSGFSKKQSSSNNFFLVIMLEKQKYSEAFCMTILKSCLFNIVRDSLSQFQNTGRSPEKIINFDSISMEESSIRASVLFECFRILTSLCIHRKGLLEQLLSPTHNEEDDSQEFGFNFLNGLFILLPLNEVRVRSRARVSVRFSVKVRDSVSP